MDFTEQQLAEAAQAAIAKAESGKVTPLAEQFLKLTQGKYGSLKNKTPQEALAYVHATTAPFRSHFKEPIITPLPPQEDKFNPHMLADMLEEEFIGRTKNTVQHVSITYPHQQILLFSDGSAIAAIEAYTESNSQHTELMSVDATTVWEYAGTIAPQKHTLATAIQTHLEAITEGSGSRLSMAYTLEAVRYVIETQQEFSAIPLLANTQQNKALCPITLAENFTNRANESEILLMETLADGNDYISIESPEEQIFFFSDASALIVYEVENLETGETQVEVTHYRPMEVNMALYHEPDTSLKVL